jgi:hypothetical protein
MQKRGQRAFEADDVVPSAHSCKLIANSELPTTALVIVCNDHRLADAAALHALLAGLSD